ESQSLRASGVLHAGRVGVEGQSERHVRELASERLMRRVHAAEPLSYRKRRARNHSRARLLSLWRVVRLVRSRRSSYRLRIARLSHLFYAEFLLIPLNFGSNVARLNG